MYLVHFKLAFARRHLCRCLYSNMEAIGGFYGFFLVCSMCMHALHKNKKVYYNPTLFTSVALILHAPGHKLIWSQKVDYKYHYVI